MAISAKRLKKTFTLTEEESKEAHSLIQEFEQKYPRFYRPTVACTATEKVMRRLSEIIGGFGVEYVSAGSNQKSPEFSYVNMGDTYDATILYVNGSFKIGDLGTMIEWGNYN